MIINSSYINMSVEHEKSESREITRSLNGQERGSQFGSQLEALLAGSQLKGSGNATFENSDDRPWFGFGLSDLSVGTFVRPFESADGADRAQSQIWQSLLKAIQPDSSPLPVVQPLSGSVVSLSELTEDGVPARIQPRVLKFELNVSEKIEEYECTQFNSCGTVNTADGRSIEFGMSLGMERSYSATREYTATQELVFTDPLILNFEGNYADLSNEKFEFDLDADGDKELISYLTGSSGMLALDRNNDGIINDGSELFGARTGDGFAELADYDEDGNGYIDEADSIFDQLMIWNKTTDTDSLETLKDRDIGAIYLGASATPFDIKGEDNQHNGTVRNSGVYFSENGEVGTLQQIDMVV